MGAWVQRRGNSEREVEKKKVPCDMPCCFVFILRRLVRGCSVRSKALRRVQRWLATYTPRDSRLKRNRQRQPSKGRDKPKREARLLPRSRGLAIKQLSKVHP